MAGARASAWGFSLLLAACAPTAQAPHLSAPHLSVPYVEKGALVVDGDFALKGKAIQGALLIGKLPNAAHNLQLDGEAVAVADNGFFMIGFGRDAPRESVLEARLEDGTLMRQRLYVMPRTYKIDYLPSLKQNNTPDPAYEALRAEEKARIKAARAHNSDLPFWQQDFRWPAFGRISGVYGSQRVLGGEPRDPHAGVDIAAPPGTPVVAPQGGIVRVAGRFSLEGNMIILDHGHGLTTAYLHLSRMAVTEGDSVVAGQEIGAVGTTGRSTGPHLHWAMSLGELRLDPQTVVPDMSQLASEK